MTDPIDPITLEVLRHRLDGIAEEMQLTLLKSAFSPIVKEGLDASAALFLPDGTTLAQASSLPLHLGAMVPAVAAMLRAFPVDAMRPGDAHLVNDPYSGGTHLPDITLMMPVFAEGRLIALAATMCHHQDVGGKSPGSIPTDATEVFQEGLRLPPLRLMRDGVMDPVLEAVLERNVRAPAMLMGDIHAQIAAAEVARRRIAETAAEHGLGAFAALCAALIDRSEAMTRAALARLPRGTFRYVDWLDNDGVELDRPIRIEVAATVGDGTIHFDFTGTSPQVRGPLNCVPSGAEAAAYYAVRALTDPTIPTNGGCFRPVSLHVPRGSLLNPIEPAPVNARTATVKRVCSCLIGALAQVIPDRLPAPPAGLSLVMAWGGRRADGSTFVVGEMVASGTGAARPAEGWAGDGVDVIQTDATNSMNLPIEAMAMEAPIRVRRLALAADSGGPGLARGGLGAVREYEVLADDVTWTYRGERHYSEARGLAGGGAGARASARIIRTDGSEEEIPSKAVRTLNRGDRVVIATAGGGGWGDPRERPGTLVAEDVANRKVSAEAARAVYGSDGPRRA